MIIINIPSAEDVRNNNTNIINHPSVINVAKRIIETRITPKILDTPPHKNYIIIDVYETNPYDDAYISYDKIMKQIEEKNYCFGNGFTTRINNKTITISRDTLIKAITNILESAGYECKKGYEYSRSYIKEYQWEISW